MDAKNILKIMDDLMKGKYTDPLLAKGIQRDWVCVVQPAVVQYLKAAWKQANPTWADQYLNPLNPLDHIMGRKTYIIDEADAAVAYMPLAWAMGKYPESFKRDREAQKSMDEQRDNTGQ